MHKWDIFERIMDLPALRTFHPFFSRHREIILYLFFGGCSFLLGIFSFLGLNSILPVLSANAVSWCVCVLFSYFTNRSFVFRSKPHTAKSTLAQLSGFAFGRAATLAVEEGILFVFITSLGFSSAAVKICAQAAVTVLNYAISKKIVFARHP